MFIPLPKCLTFRKPAKAGFLNLQTALLTLLIVSVVSFGQTPLKSQLEEYHSIMSLRGYATAPTLNYRSLSNNIWIYSDSLVHPWQQWVDSTQQPLWQKDSLRLTVVPTTFFSSYNQETPFGMNDGGLWQGVGYNGMLRTGATFKSRYFEATFAPELYFSENKYYSILQSDTAWNGSEWGSYVAGIDNPQRFGDKEFWDWSFGQSEIRFNYKAFTLGAGTQNAWIGTGKYQAIILSNNAKGFPKIDIGMNRKETRIGSFETRFWWGWLKSSSYYAGGNDTINPGTPDTFLDFTSGFTFSYAPKFIQGLTVGVQKTSQTPLSNVSFYSIVAGVDPGFGGKDKWGEDTDLNDNRFSITWDWLFPVVGFEFYGEWSREDYTGDALESAEHTRGLTMGVRQAFDLTKQNKHILSAEIEASSIVWSRDYLINRLGWGGGYYRHHKTNIGYTYEGQIVGAGMGTGGSYQHYAVNYYAPFGMAGVYALRHKGDDSPIYGAAYDSTTRVPVHIEVGTKGSVLLPKHFQISSSIAYVRFHNWNMIRNNDKKGLRFTLSVDYLR